MSDDEGDVHVCEVCQEILLGTHDLEEHMKDAHTKGAKNENDKINEADVHVCEVCQEIILGTHDLEEHMKDAHSKEAKDEDDKKMSQETV